MTMTKPEPIDMSAEAIARRLEQVRALYKLMASLRQIRVDEARSSAAVSSGSGDEPT
jgi:hypothetical protein